MMKVSCLSTQPVSITDHRSSRVLHITWADGRLSLLPHAWLRSHCRCAACVQATRSGVVAAQADVEITAILPIADRAINLAFSDEHDRGIYPWDYLRALGDEIASAPCGAAP